MTKDLAAEFAKDNVRVNSVHPGYVRTQMAAQAANAAGISVEELGKHADPLGRLAEPIDIANTGVFLASDTASFATGTEFILDGGETNLL